MAASKRATARGAVAAPRAGSPALGRFTPSARSLAIGFGVLLVAGGAYATARETSVFALRHLEIVGGSPRTQAAVRTALSPELGRSLLAVSGNEIARRVAPLSDVVSVSFDRAFPHTLRVVVRPERAVLLLRRGHDSWVVSTRGRVMREIRRPGLSSLPRTWVPRDTAVTVGDRLAPSSGGRAAATLAAVGPALPGVRFVRVAAGELTFVLRLGPQIRFGDIRDLRLKLAIARRILKTIGPDPAIGYLDVSVPERPVVGSAKSQVEG